METKSGEGEPGWLAFQKRCHEWATIEGRQFLIRAGSCPHYHGLYPLRDLRDTDAQLAELEAAPMACAAPLLRTLAAHAAHPILQLPPNHPLWRWTDQELQQLQGARREVCPQGRAAAGQLLRTAVQAGSQDRAAELQERLAQADQRRKEPRNWSPLEQGKGRPEEEGMSQLAAELTKELAGLWGENERLRGELARRAGSSSNRSRSSGNGGGGGSGGSSSCKGKPQPSEAPADGPPEEDEAFISMASLRGVNLDRLELELTAAAQALKAIGVPPPPSEDFEFRRGTAGSAPSTRAGDAGAGAWDARNTPTKARRASPPAEDGVVAAPSTPFMCHPDGGRLAEDSIIKREAETSAGSGPGAGQQQQPTEEARVAGDPRSAAAPRAAAERKLQWEPAEAGAGGDVRRAEDDRAELLGRLQAADLAAVELRLQLQTARQALQQERKRRDAATEEVERLRSRLEDAEQLAHIACREANVAAAEATRLQHQLEAAIAAAAAATAPEARDAAAAPVAPTSPAAAAAHPESLSSLLESVQHQLCALAERAAAQALLNTEAVTWRASAPEAAALNGTERLRRSLQEARRTASLVAAKAAQLQGSLEATVTASADARTAADESRRAATAGRLASREALELVRALPVEYDRLGHLRDELATALRDAESVQAGHPAAAAEAAAGAWVRQSWEGAAGVKEEAVEHASRGLQIAPAEDCRLPVSPRPSRSGAAVGGVERTAAVVVPLHQQQLSGRSGLEAESPCTHISIQAYSSGGPRRASVTATF